MAKILIATIQVNSVLRIVIIKIFAIELSSQSLSSFSTWLFGATHFSQLGCFYIDTLLFTLATVHVLQWQICDYENLHLQHYLIGTLSNIKLMKTHICH